QLRTADPASILERILHQDGVVALGAGGEERHRALDQLLDGAHVLDGLRRQLGPAARPARRLGPTLEALVDRLEARLCVVPRGQARDALAVEHIADAYLQGVEAVEHVELGECDPVDARRLHRLAQQAGVEPAAPAPAPRHRTELMAALADL